jgi:3-isopropylmalate/(R)-2-methylmalate dehydratase small subunit
MIFEGIVCKFGDKISTDLMMPGEVMANGSLSDLEKARHCMRACRPGWAQNLPPGRIIIAGHHWDAVPAAPRLGSFKHFKSVL